MATEHIPEITPEIQLDMKRTLLALAADQYGRAITHVYVEKKDGTIKDEVDLLVNYK